MFHIEICRVLQCVAVCSNVLQCVAVCCSEEMSRVSRRAHRTIPKSRYRNPLLYQENL